MCVFVCVKGGGWLACPIELALVDGVLFLPLSLPAQLSLRFVPTMGWLDAGRFMRAQVIDSANKVTTTIYDGIQKLQNDIHSATFQ